MNRVVPMLMGLGLVASGCAAASRAPRLSYRNGYGQPAQESVQAYVRLPTLASTSSRPRYRRASRRYRSPMPASPSGGPSKYRSSPGSSSSRSSSRRVVHRVVKAQPASAPAGASAPPTSAATGAQVPPSRLVIYAGTLVLRIFKLADAADLAQKLALETGAYIQSRHNAQMVIRVPVGRFHELMARLSAVGEVAGKSIAAQDVTQQYFDITHRLKAAHAVLTRLKSLLLKARNVNESLQIEREMSRLLTRIERFKGLLRYLRHHASLSTITVYFRVKPRYSRPLRTHWRSPFGWVKGLGLWRMMQF